MASNFYF